LALAAAPLRAAGSPGDFADSIATFSHDEALRRAKAENKHVFVYFWTQSCPWCAAFTERVLADPDIQAFLAESFVVVSVNADKERRLARRYRVPSVPYLAFLDPSGNLVGAIPEAVAANHFLLYLEYLRTGSYARLGFREFVESLI
jgi:thioredoxin-related protein